jgi:hypothetical protein
MEPDSGPVTHGLSRRRELPALPEASEKWLPQARSWFNSLALSGQSEFFEASDWMMAVIAAEAYDKFLRTYNASILASFVRISERLGATHADRIRSRIVLDAPDLTDVDEEHADNVIRGWQSRLQEKRQK